jgi:hypothetical protein
MSEQYQPPVPVFVALSIDGYEALYVDGDLRDQDDTIYASTIAAKTNGMPIVLRYVELEQDVGTHWPERYEDLQPYMEATQ